MKHAVVDAQIIPEGRLDVLSKAEVNKLFDKSQGGLYRIFRNCSLAVLNCGSAMDDGKELLERYPSFDIRVIQEQRGIKLEVKGAPAHAFVDGKMIKGINEHLFASCATLFTSVTRSMIIQDLTWIHRMALLMRYSTYCAMPIFCVR